MIGRQLVQALAGRQEPPRAKLPAPQLAPEWAAPPVIGRELTEALLFPPEPPPPGPGLQRPCGCDCDVAVFGHVCCPDAPPWAHLLEG